MNLLKIRIDMSYDLKIGLYKSYESFEKNA